MNIGTYQNVWTMCVGKVLENFRRSYARQIDHMSLRRKIRENKSQKTKNQPFTEFSYHIR